MNVTDDRQTTDGWATAYSKRRSLKTLLSTLSGINQFVTKNSCIQQQTKNLHHLFKLKHITNKIKIIKAYFVKMLMKFISLFIYT